MKFSHPHFQSTEYEERNILKRTQHQSFFPNEAVIVYTATDSLGYDP